MAWRFKVSKYKNASPKFPKKEEQVLDLPVTDITQSCGNHIKASCIYTVFNVDSSGGGNLGFLPLSASGRQSNVPIIQAHGDFVTDFDFSPFDDYLLATGSQDNKVSLWLLPDENDTSVTAISEPVVSLPVFERRVENVLWNPQADGILACTSHTSVKIFDVTGADGKQVYEFSGHGDQIQSVTWQGEGTLMATSCRDKKLRVIDPRSGTVVQEGKGHQNIKDSRLLWLPRKDFMISTGFSQSRSRQVSVWDQRNLSSSLHTMDIDNSTGIIMPLHDPDTSMTFLIGKGDTSLNFMEFTEKDPYLTSSGVDRCEQIKGVAMVPKRSMSLMDGEVNRLLVLCQRSIVPAPYIVPRKSYRDFHADLYPVTLSGEPALSAAQWINGDSAQPSFISPEPGKKLVKRERRGKLVGVSGTVTVPASPTKQSLEVMEPSTNKPAAAATTTESPPSPQVKVASDSSKPQINKPKPQSSTTAAAEPLPEKPKPSPKPATKPFADTDTPVIRNGSKVTDFVWDPFDDRRLVVGELGFLAIGNLLWVSWDVGFLTIVDLLLSQETMGLNVAKRSTQVFILFSVTDNARINVWRIPENGLEESIEEPEFCLRGHMEKIYFVRFHPLASSLITTASYDMTVRLWDLDQRKEVMTLEGIEDQVYNLSWSSNGKFCATVSKDKKIRVFEPRESTVALREGPGPEGSRGARVVWTLQDKYLVVTGFDRSELEGQDNNQVI
ncbi:coronin [Elysia marginata]|uniref:Coronin n=1 Tax=Elysia marginata TaxID=1093978 RepID=A0AAV4IAP1_9GAST|nr:coronin [Elysia marginata]